jgi:chromosome segregation ATPase
MTDNIQRSLGTLEGKLDSLIVAVEKSEAKADAARAAFSARMAENENRASENRDAIHLRLNTLEHKVEQTRTEGHATLKEVEAMKPVVEDMKRMRTQGIAVAAVLTTLGGIFGTTLYALKDKLWSFFAGS